MVESARPDFKNGNSTSSALEKLHLNYDFMEMPVYTIKVCALDI